MDQMLLCERVPLVLDCLSQYSYSGEYMNTFRRRLNQVVEHYTAMGIIHYTPGQYEKYLFHITDEYVNGRLRVDLFWAYRKCAYYLDEYCRLGYVEPKMLIQESRQVYGPRHQEQPGLGRVGNCSLQCRLGLRHGHLRPGADGGTSGSEAHSASR